jgi:integrase
MGKPFSVEGVKKLIKAGKPGRYSDAAARGLYLQIGERRASWVFRYRERGTGRHREMGLGACDAATLAEARVRANEARSLLAQDIDPIQERKQRRTEESSAASKIKTFDQCAAAFIESKRHGWKNEKHANQWTSTLKRHAASLGPLPVQSIELTHILDVLQPIWTTIPETAARVRGRIELVLAYATASGYRDGSNPAAWKGNLSAILAAPSKVKNVQHLKGVPIDGMHEFWKRLLIQPGMGARAVEFTILTAARSGEVRGATWGELDLKANVWRIPAHRMKAGREHAVPLSPAVLAILHGFPQGEPDQLVFPAPRGGMLSDMTLTAVLRRMKVDATVHGFRSTFRTWAAERTNYPHEVCEQALAHTLRAVEKAYKRTDFLEKRRPLMSEWSKFLVTPPVEGANVVPINAANTVAA